MDNKKYSYTKEEITILQYLTKNWKEIGKEYELQGKGNIIQEMETL